MLLTFWEWTLNPNDRDQAQILLDRLLAAGACKITFK